jgi:hypothetical protein
VQLGSSSIQDVTACADKLLFKTGVEKNKDGGSHLQVLELAVDVESVL